MQTSQPDVPFKIEINDRDITDQLRPYFVSLTINDAAGIESDSVQLVLADDGKVAFPRTAATMQVYTGTNMQSLLFRGRYTINSVKLSSPERRITIAGDAANLGGSFKTQRDYTWQNCTLKTLVETVAQRNGFIASVEAKYANIPIENHIQAGQSDADLVTELAKEHGATMKVADNKLIFFQRGNNQSVSGQTLPPIPVHITDETEATIELKGSGNVQAVEAYWQAVEQGQKQRVRVGQSDGKVKQLSKIFPSQEAAKAAAEAALYQEQRSDYVLTLSELPYITGIQAERSIVLSGHQREEFNTEWMCSRVTETLGTEGHVVEGEFVLKNNLLDE